jgi:serine/threonine-protein kinase
MTLGDRYRLERLIGEGGTGAVWEATHVVMRRRVALKLLKAADDTATRRFFREARVTAALRHPNIVDVHDVFVPPETGSAAMVMEYLVGTSLAHYLREGTARISLSPRQAACVMVPIVAALTAAHQVGVVHRDLKPANVFLVGGELPDANGAVVKVLDFGLAKLTASDGIAASTGDLTRTGFVLGTPHYMAPEQVTHDGEVDPRSDVWALGVMFYEMLAGQRPIQGDNISQLFRAIADPKIVPIAKRVPTVPRALAKLTSKMLAKDKEDRPSLEDIADVLSGSV